MITMQNKIEEKLRNAFEPSYLLVVNESEKHHGHSGDDGSGESHFSVHIISNCFSNMNKIDCHRMIYSALSDEMKTVHAVSLSVSAN